MGLPTQEKKINQFNDSSVPQDCQVHTLFNYMGRDPQGVNVIYTPLFVSGKE